MVACVFAVFVIRHRNRNLICSFPFLLCGDSSCCNLPLIVWRDWLILRSNQPNLQHSDTVFFSVKNFTCVLTFSNSSGRATPVGMDSFAETITPASVALT